MSLTIKQVHRLAVNAGLTHDAAVTATAVAMAESGLNPYAKGDVSLQDSKWGPSLGLWQIRSLHREQGTGGTRDATKLTNPVFNAKSMAAISNGGIYWNPWSVYTSGAWRKNIAAVRAAVGAKDDATLTAPTPSGGTSSTGSVQQAGVVGDALDSAGDWLSDKNPFRWDRVRAALITGGGMALAVGLIAVGAWKLAG